MNKIVLEHYPASKLPQELRGDIPSRASVRVVIEEEAAPQHQNEDSHAQWLRLRRNLTKKVTIEEAVERVGDLREEWDH